MPSFLALQRPTGTFSLTLTVGPRMGWFLSTCLIYHVAFADPSQDGASRSLVVAQQSARGKLNNPFTDPAAIAEGGRSAYLKAQCQNYHGRDASRGPSLINDRWVFNNDDDTIFRLLALGSEEMQRQGYRSEGRENSHWSIPSQGEFLSSNDLWQIIGWLRLARQQNESIGEK